MIVFTYLALWFLVTIILVLVQDIRDILNEPLDR